MSSDLVNVYASGTRGLSAYQEAVVRGFVGTFDEWTQIILPVDGIAAIAQAADTARQGSVAAAESAAADRQQTGLDRLATAADREQTALDVLAATAAASTATDAAAAVSTAVGNINSVLDVINGEVVA